MPIRLSRLLKFCCEDFLLVATWIQLLTHGIRYGWPRLLNAAVLPRCKVRGRGATEFREQLRASEIHESRPTSPP